jgi:hypothetical protein
VERCHRLDSMLEIDKTIKHLQGEIEMYVDDERFTRNIDKFGEGLATFMRDAMAIFADSANK